MGKHRAKDDCVVEQRLANGPTLFGVVTDKNIVVASLKAVVSGVNRVLKRS